MKLRNGFALSAMFVVSYFVYAQQPSEAGPADLGASQAGPASAGQAGPATPAPVTRKSGVLSLQQMSAELLARKIHDNELDFPEGVTTPEQKQQAIEGMFPYEAMKKLIADAYCRLYPQEIARQMHDEGNFVAGVARRFDQLSKDIQEDIAQEYAQLYPEEFKPRLIQTITGDYASVKFASDGSLLLISSAAGLQVLRWQDSEFRVIQNINNISDVKLAVSAQGDWFAVGLQSPIRVFVKGNDNRFTLSQNIAIGIHQSAVIGGLGLGDISENNKVIAACYKNINDVTVIHIFSQRNPNAPIEHIQEIPYQISDVGSNITSISFDSTGTHFASASLDGTVKIWSRNGGTGRFAQTSILRPPVNFSRGISRVAFSPDNRFVVLMAGTNIVIWKQTSSDNFELFQHIPNVVRGDGSIGGISFNPDNSNCFASAARDGVKIWYLSKNSNTFRNIYTISGCAYGVSFGPDGKLAVALRDGIQIWRFNMPSVERVRDHLLRKVMHQEMLSTEDMPELEETP